MSEESCLVGRRLARRLFCGYVGPSSRGVELDLASFVMNREHSALKELVPLAPMFGRLVVKHDRQLHAWSMP